MTASASGEGLTAGVVVGQSRCYGADAWHRLPVRIGEHEVARELNGLRVALECAQAELSEPRRLECESESGLPQVSRDLLEQHARALHDAVFIADVESLLIAERLSLSSAIRKVVADAQRMGQVLGGVSAERSLRLEGLGRRLLGWVEPVPLEGPRIPRVMVLAGQLELSDLLPCGPVRPVAVVCGARDVRPGLLPWLHAYEIVALVNVGEAIKHLPCGVELKVSVPSSGPGAVGWVSSGAPPVGSLAPAAPQFPEPVNPPR